MLCYWAYLLLINYSTIKKFKQIGKVQRRNYKIALNPISSVTLFQASPCTRTETEGWGEWGWGGVCNLIALIL